MFDIPSRITKERLFSSLNILEIRVFRVCSSSSFDAHTRPLLRKRSTAQSQCCGCQTRIGYVLVPVIDYSTLLTLLPSRRPKNNQSTSYPRFKRRTFFALNTFMVTNGNKHYFSINRIFVLPSWSSFMAFSLFPLYDPANHIVVAGNS